MRRQIFSSDFGAGEPVACMDCTREVPTTDWSEHGQNEGVTPAEYVECRSQGY